MKEPSRWSNLAQWGPWAVAIVAVATSLMAFVSSKKTQKKLDQLLALQSEQVKALREQVGASREQAGAIRGLAPADSGTRMSVVVGRAFVGEYGAHVYVEVNNPSERQFVGVLEASIQGDPQEAWSLGASKTSDAEDVVLEAGGAKLFGFDMDIDGQVSVEERFKVLVSLKNQEGTEIDSYLVDCDGVGRGCKAPSDPTDLLERAIARGE